MEFLNSLFEGLNIPNKKNVMALSIGAVIRVNNLKILYIIYICNIIFIIFLIN